MAWDDMLAMADQAVAAFFDTEDFTAAAYMRAAGKSRNDDPVPDPARPSFDFKGSFDLDPSLDGFGGSSRASSESLAPRHVSRTAVSATVTGWAWRPTKGDVLVRHKDGLRYMLAMPADSDGTDRLVFWVNRVS